MQDYSIRNQLSQGPLENMEKNSKFLPVALITQQSDNSVYIYVHIYQLHTMEIKSHKK